MFTMSFHQADTETYHYLVLALFAGCEGMHIDVLGKSFFPASFYGCEWSLVPDIFRKVFAPGAPNDYI